MKYSDKRETQLTKADKEFLLNKRLCNHAVSCISYHAIDTILDVDELEDFNSWIRGQTTCDHGVYWHDWERWVNGFQVTD